MLLNFLIKNDGEKELAIGNTKISNCRMLNTYKISKSLTKCDKDKGNPAKGEKKNLRPVKSVSWKCHNFVLWHTCNLVGDRIIVAAWNIYDITHLDIDIKVQLKKRKKKNSNHELYVRCLLLSSFFFLSFLLFQTYFTFVNVL